MWDEPELCGNCLGDRYSCPEHGPLPLIAQLRADLAAAIARAERAEWQLALAEAEVAVRGGEWCAENRAEGRNPCGACAWCCNQAIARAERAERALEEREGDMHMRIRAGYDAAVADAFRAEVAKLRAQLADAQAAREVAERGAAQATQERDEARRHLDDGRAAYEAVLETEHSARLEANRLWTENVLLTRERDEARAEVSAKTAQRAAAGRMLTRALGELTQAREEATSFTDSMRCPRCQLRLALAALSAAKDGER